MLKKIYHFIKSRSFFSKILLQLDFIIPRKLKSHNYFIYSRMISGHWVKDGYESDIREAFIQLIKEKRCKTFYDIGANVGIFSLDFLTHFQGKTVAFEPNPTVFECLKKTKSKNKLDHFEIQNLALSNHDQKGVLTFDPLSPALGGLNPIKEGKYNHEINYNGVSKKVEVRITTLDQFVSASNEPPDLIKIDAEGEELNILKGAKKTCETLKPVLLFECSKDETEIANLLRNYNYQIYDLTLKKIDFPSGMNIAISTLQ